MSSRHGTVLFALLLPGLLCVGCADFNATPGVASQVLGGGPITVEVVRDGMLVARVEVPAGALPDGATARLRETTLVPLEGLAIAGPAIAVDFSAPLASGQLGTVTIRFDPCLLRAQDASTDDLVLLREWQGVVGPVPYTTDGETLTTEVDRSVVLAAAVPEGTAIPVPPMCGMSYHGIAVGEGGSVYTWGWNGFGQIGDRTTTLRTSARKVAGLENAVSVEAGEDFSVALLGDGSVYAWGANYAGQLGDGSTDDQDRPVRVALRGCVRRIAVGPTSHTVLALAEDGQLYAWGQNNFGQAGPGAPADQSLPVPIDGIMHPRDFAVTGHALAVLEDGTVWAWGRNDQGQLGNGTFASGPTPVMVEDLDDVVAVAAGANFSVALCADGSVWAWGALNRRLAGGSFPRVSTRPVRVAPIIEELTGEGEVVTTEADPIVLIDATSDAIVAVDAAERVWTFDTVGPGRFFAVTPVRDFFPDRQIVDIDGGVQTILARLDDGTYIAWGSNDLGQLGDGTFLPSLEPMLVPGLPD